jgi:hypothetical protein
MHAVSQLCQKCHATMQNRTSTFQPARVVSDMTGSNCHRSMEKFGSKAAHMANLLAIGFITVHDIFANSQTLNLVYRILAIFCQKLHSSRM